MKKNFIAGVIVSLAISGIFGGVSFAADKAPDAKAAVTTEAKADAPPPQAKHENTLPLSFVKLASFKVQR